MTIDKQAIPTGKCWCGCGSATAPNRFFKATHDAKAFGYLTNLYQGEHGNDGLANILLTLGYDDEDGVCPTVLKESDMKLPGE